MRNKLFTILTYATIAMSFGCYSKGEYGPAWSPNGKKIAYTKVDEQNHWNLAIRTIDDGTERIIAPSDGYDTDPSWSPDGTRVAFTSSRTGNRDIYVYNLVTNTLEVIVSHPEMDNQPVWSPDGKEIVFLARRTGTSQLYIYDVAAATTRQVSDEAVHVFHPNWDADGKNIIADQQQDGKSQIFQFDPITGLKTPLYKGEGSNIAAKLWNDRLMFSTNRRGNWDIYGVDLTTQQEYPIFEALSDEMKADYHSPSNSFVYSKKNEAGEFVLMVSASKHDAQKQAQYISNK